MAYRIALLLKEHFRETIKGYLADKPFKNVQFDFYAYETIEELQQQFLSVSDRYDGFFVSGPIPLRAIRLLGPVGENALIGAVTVNLENVYQLLLRHIITVGLKNVDLSRVGIDFLQEGETLEELIRSERLYKAASDYVRRWTQSLQSVEEIEAEELRMQEHYLKLCQERKVDVIITYYYSVIDRVRRFGIPCHYVYREKWVFFDCMKQLIQDISAQKRRSAVIHIGAGNNPDKADAGTALTEAVRIFDQMQHSHAIFKESYDDLELYLSFDALKRLTGNFCCCPLLPFLQKQLGFSGAVGYGIGETLYQARLNAVNASAYGKTSRSAHDGSYLLDEHEALTFLAAGCDQQKPSKLPFSISAGAVTTIAARANLSADTVLRIAEVLDRLGASQLSSQELMDALHVSLRSANKFLSALERAGYAAVCGKKRTGEKGRPVNIYKVSLELH